MFFISVIPEFIGRFHPVLVHLPVGILLLAVIFYFLSYKKKYEWIEPAVQLSLLIGTIAAIASCITGYLLSDSGGYNAVLVSRHQWFGIGMTVVSLITYYVASKKMSYFKWLMPLIGILIIITGHLGGSITHGEGYLTKAFTEKNTTGEVSAALIKDVQQAVAYTDIIQPILQTKCYACHGTSKQKGKLRLDEPDFILKGGEDGKIMIPGSAGESEMIKRILLAADNEDHMPPKEKPQLTAAQIELLHWWITTGATFNKKVAALSQPDKVKPVLMALQTGNIQPAQISLSTVPAVAVEKAPDSILQKLKLLDVAVNAVAANSNYLTVNFVAVDSITAQHLQLIKALGKQIIWLKMGDAKLNDEVCAAIGALPNLTRLFLNNTNVADNGLAYFKSLAQLQYLNLIATNITASGMKHLAGLKNIKQLYLYQTNISKADFANIKNDFPGSVIDTGGYQLEFLASDTMKVKAKLVKP